MPDFEVREVDVDDEAQLHAWWQAGHDGATAGRPYDLYPTWELARVAYPDRHPDWDFVLVSVHDGDRVVGAGLVNMPLADNLSNAYLEVYVPEQRRGGGGHGTARRRRGTRPRAGRTVLSAEAVARPAAPARGSRSPRRAATRWPTARASRSWTSAEHPGGRRWRSRSPIGSVTTGSSSGAAPRRRSTSRRCAAR